jgi:hypothetical protein
MTSKGKKLTRADAKHVVDHAMIEAKDAMRRLDKSWNRADWNKLDSVVRHNAEYIRDRMNTIIAALPEKSDD